MVNPLIAVNTVPSELRVYSFIRAADNFELSQMKTPKLALGGSVFVPPKNEYLVPYNFEIAWYVTWNRKATVKGTDGVKTITFVHRIFRM